MSQLCFRWRQSAADNERHCHGDRCCDSEKDQLRQQGETTAAGSLCIISLCKTYCAKCVPTSYICITGQLASIQLHDYCRMGNFCGHEIFCYNSWLDSYTKNIICEVIIVTFARMHAPASTKIYSTNHFVNTLQWCICKCFRLQKFPSYSMQQYDYYVQFVTWTIRMCMMPSATLSALLIQSLALMHSANIPCASCQRVCRNLDSQEM